MKNKIFSICTLFLVAFSAATCKKENTLEMELAKLPPATQTGQNTFGCLINGKAWVAQNKDCFPYCDPSFKLYYDTDFGGYIGITAVWLNSKSNIDQVINVWTDSSDFKNEHEIRIERSLTGARFIDYKKPGNCASYERFVDSAVVYSGMIDFNLYDLQSGIISGTFEFTLFKPGCDTIKVTHGRFDKKL